MISLTGTVAVALVAVSVRGCSLLGSSFRWLSSGAVVGVNGFRRKR